MPARVSSYMTDKVITISPDDTLAHARRVMLQSGVNRLIVVDEEQPVGVLTVTDIINTIMGRFVGHPLDSVYVSQAMSRDLKTIRVTQSIKTAASLMVRYKIGGLPVITADERLVGIITRTDLMRAYADRSQGRFSVGQVMRREVAVVRPEHHIFYVASKVQADPAGKVVVIDGDNRPIGIIAKRDLAFVTLPPSVSPKRRGKLKKRKVVDPSREKIVAARFYPIQVAEEIMTPNPLTIAPGADLADAAALMYEQGIGALPVVNDDGELVGIVTKVDIVEVIARFF